MQTISAHYVALCDAFICPPRWKGVLPALRAAITACDIAITLRLERAVPGVIAVGSAIVGFVARIGGPR